MPSKSAEIGDVPDHWEVGILRDFIDLITYGFTNPMPDSEVGPWKLTAKDVVGGRINYQTARRTTEEAFSKLLTDKSRPKIGDVLLTKDGSIGRLGVVDREGTCINQSVALLRSNAKILPYFLKFMLETPHYQNRMEGDSDGSTIKHIYITRVDKMQVAVPPVCEQESILGIVKTIDDKIALLWETNATLEAIAQALFKSWFVDFDPVRAKAEGRDPEGVPPEVADLFPSEFQDSELWAIPKGWRVGTLADYSELNPESWTNKHHPSTILYVDLANTKDNRIETATEYQFEDAPSRARRVLRSGDTIVGTVRPGNRSFAYVLNPPETLTGSTGFAVLRPLRQSEAEFIFIAASRNESIDRLAHLADGGAYPAVRPEVVQSLPVVVPPASILVPFHQIVAPLLERVSTNDLEANSLTKLRDTILPRLMSGRFHIEEA